MFKTLFLSVIILSSIIVGRADNLPDSVCDATPLRPLTATYSLNIGASKDLNTYLSPIRQSGTHLGLGASWSRATGFNPEKFLMDFDAQFAMNLDRNSQHTSSMTGIDFSLAWDILRRFRPLPNLHLAAGAGMEFDAGALYLPRNSNNPVAARVSLDLTLNLRADYRLNIGSLPILLSDRFSLPSLGVFFSPQYGQSYYEIYLGDDSGLAHCGWWGNHFAVANTFMVKVPICNIHLCAGYRVQCRSSYVNDINTRLVSHSLIVGISTDWINVTCHADSSRRIIRAY